MTPWTALWSEKDTLYTLSGSRIWSVLSEYDSALLFDRILNNPVYSLKEVDCWVRDLRNLGGFQRPGADWIAQDTLKAPREVTGQAWGGSSQHACRALSSEKSRWSARWKLRNNNAQFILWILLITSFYISGAKKMADLHILSMQLETCVSRSEKAKKWGCKRMWREINL